MEGSIAMTRRISTVSLDTALVLRKVKNGDLSSAQGTNRLLALAQLAETAADVDFIHIARKHMEEIEATMARPNTT